MSGIPMMLVLIPIFILKMLSAEQRMRIIVVNFIAKRWIAYENFKLKRSGKKFLPPLDSLKRLTF